MKDEERCLLHGEKLDYLTTAVTDLRVDGARNEERTVSILRICRTNFALYCLTLSIFSGAMLVGCAVLENLPEPPVIVEPTAEELSVVGQVTVVDSDFYREE